MHDSAPDQSMRSFEAHAHEPEELGVQCRARNWRRRRTEATSKMTELTRILSRPGTAGGFGAGGASDCASI